MYNVELTDTFAGEANYSWVRRAAIEEPGHFPKTTGEHKARQRLIMRRAKAAVGMSGVRGVTQNYGDTYEFRPYGACVVLFVTWSDEN